MEPNPSQVAPWYLRNITQALALDSVTGNVYVRTDAQFNVANANISVSNVGVTSLGNVNIAGNTLPVSGNIVISSGNIAITSLPEVEIKNDSGNPVPISANSSVNSSTNPIYIDGNVTVASGNINASLAAGIQDAFGRLRVAQPFTLFDCAFIGTNDGHKFDTALSGGASTTYNSYESTVSMTVGTASGDQVIRQSYRTFPYQPGKALEIFSTFNMAESQPNLRQRVGYFTAYNGIYLELDGTVTSFVIRQQTGASTYVEDRVEQSDWNVDTMLGTGGAANPSGIDLDLSKSQILYTAIEWLGVGSVFMGFVIDGNYVIAHRFDHANMTTSTYMQSAQQSIRLEITNTAATSGATMRQICSSVISSGGYSPAATQQFAGRGLSYYTMSTAGTLYNLVSMRLGADGMSYNKVVYLDALNVLTDSNQNLEWQVILNPTFASGPTWANVTNFTQSTTSNVTVTGGTVIGTGFVVNKGEPASLSGDLFKYQIGRSIAGVSDVICIAVTPDSNNVKLGGTAGFFEI